MIVTESSKNPHGLMAAVVQMCSSDNIADNLRQVLEGLNEAAARGASLVVLPENALCFGASDQESLTASKALIDAQRAISECAQKHSIGVLLGTLPVASPDPQRVYAQSQWIDTTGQVSGRYNKMHLFDITTHCDAQVYRESDTFFPGNEPMSVTLSMGIPQLDDFEAIMSVCYDLRFPEYYRTLLNAHTRIAFVPSAFTYVTGQAHWEILLKARAIENQLFVLAANQGGTHYNLRRTWGHSMIISPWGSVLCEVKKQGFAVAMALLDFNEQDRIRMDMPCLSHRRLR